MDWSDPTASPWNNPGPLTTYTLTNRSGASLAAGPDYDGMYLFSPGCATTQPHDANGYPTGPWSATHTYPAASDIPSVLYVNFYDPHGQAGQPSGGVGWPEVNSIAPEKRSSDFVAAGPNHDGFVLLRSARARHAGAP